MATTTPDGGTIRTGVNLLLTSNVDLLHKYSYFQSLANNTYKIMKPLVTKKPKLSERDRELTSLLFKSQEHT
ncbi:MAG: hypothetical protein JRJ77_15555 [Deltaproteobacteria bacterium]|nr:hypothetical protein [Deltaproteobacteria bacterium]MBW2342145.1 hypothetical protein [Deltaproteobacteria bacterium]